MLLWLLKAASAVLQGGKRTTLLDAHSKHGFLRWSAPQSDVSTAFIMFATSDSFFVDLEDKNATGFAYGVANKLSQVVNVPWTRFGVFSTVYNATDHTPLPGKMYSCLPDATTQKIECKVVSHEMNKSGILAHETFLQTSAKQIKFEVIVQSATFQNGDTMLASTVAENLVRGAQDSDPTLATKFHMLFPNTQATLGTTPFIAGPWGGPQENSETLGVNPSGHRSGAMKVSENGPAEETAVDVAAEAQKINAENLKRLAETDGALQRSAVAHYDAMRFNPYTPPTVLPSGPLMLPHPDYPPGPDF